MRTFYIFNINKEMAILTKNSPYNMFKSLEKIYKLDKKDFSVGLKLFEQLAIPFDNNKLNTRLYNTYKENDHYTKYRNIHKINNRYKPEESKLVVNNVYLLLKSNIVKPLFLKELNKHSNLFVCDFENKDYFWLESLSI